MFRKIYGAITAIESILVPVFVVSITVLVFISAVMRTMGRPINWAVDVSLLLLAWSVALGGDLAIRRDRVVNVDMVVNRFPPAIRKFLALLWCVVIMIFLGCLVKYGIDLCMSNRKRIYQTLQIGYIWATAAVPTGAFLMFISMAVRFVRIWLNLPLAPAVVKDEEIGGAF